MYRLIIADDEEIECKALGMMIHKNFSDIELLPDASNGVELIERVEAFKPDIAIVDINMAGINGLDAIGLIKMKSIDVRIIVNTAYNSFEYVQKAISLGADDYILKPEKRERIVQTIAKLCRAIDEERLKKTENNKLSKLVSGMIPIIESEIMFSIFLGEPSKASFQTYREIKAIDFFFGVVVSSRISPESGDQDSAALAKIVLYIKDELALLCSFIASSAIKGSISFFVISDRMLPDPTIWIREIFLLIADKVQSRFQSSAIFGIGTPYADFAEMSQSYRQSVIALNRCRTPNHVNAFSEFIPYLADSTPFDASVDTVAVSIISSDEETCWRSVELAFKKIPFGQELSITQGMVLSFLLAVNDALLAKDVFFFAKVSSYKSLYEKVFSLTSIADMKVFVQSSFTDLAGTLGTGQRVNLSHYVTETVSYINKNFSAIISLDSVAEVIDVSPYYLSRLFKQEMRQNFVDYLTETRMRKAVELATTTRLSIKDISKNVGYLNHTYFCKVFKLHTGKTIREIREQQWQNNANGEC